MPSSITRGRRSKTGCFHDCSLCCACTGRHLLFSKSADSAAGCGDGAVYHHVSGFLGHSRNVRQSHAQSKVIAKRTETSSLHFLLRRASGRHRLRRSHFLPILSTFAASKRT